MHEVVASVMYYFSIHVLYASLVGVAAALLTCIRGASATAKYWIWVLTAFNFVVPSGAIIDKLFAPHLMWARPLGGVSGLVWNMTQGRTALLLGVIWIAGAFILLMRLMSRVRSERSESHAQTPLKEGDASNSVADGVPVSFVEGHSSPSVRGILFPSILLPAGIDRMLNPREFHAVLIHELAHARRRDNLIRLLYEFLLSVLWLHPLIWLAGARIALYRELSCDESVIRRAHGQALVSALAKLAVPQRTRFLEATASSHLSYRLARLAGPAQPAHRAASLLLTSLFTAVIAAGVFATVAHTACCFVPKH